MRRQSRWATMSSLPVDQLKDEYLTCSICFQQFTSPKTLPSCLHTFCLACVEDFIHSKGRNYAAAGRFPCPICRQEAVIPQSGAAGFPDNHMLQSLLADVSSPPGPRRTEQPAPPKLDGPRRPPPPEDTAASRAEDAAMLHQFGRYGPGVADFQRPYGLATSPEGEILVSDQNGNRILIFRFGQPTRKLVCDCAVSGIALSVDGHIMAAVSKAGQAILKVYTKEGTWVADYTGLFYKYANPSGVAVSMDNHAVVTSLENHCVYVFTDKRKLSAHFGWKGSGDERFLSPHFVTTDRKNQIIVSDTGNHCIKVFDMTGKFKLRFSKRGQEAGMLFNPKGICVDSHCNIIVADSGNYRVQAFSPKGKFLSYLVENTSKIGENVQPINVAMNVRDDNIVVVLLAGPQFAEVRTYLWTPPPPPSKMKDYQPTCKTS